ncbi:MAG TPA: long-chain fatty acid--CoA ligase [Polyangiaceae bacterium]|nr:long-chain fatty acid--CoA ligase [Polyangiaceae bacterium]
MPPRMHEDFPDLVSMWERITTRYAERPLFGKKSPSGWVWQTYAQVAEQVEAFRLALLELGVGPGDRVALISDNRLEWAVVAHATLGNGAAYVPMYEAQTRDDWGFILRDSAAKVVFGASAEIVAALDQLKPSLPQLEHVFGFDLDAKDPRSFAALLAKGRSAAKRPAVKPNPDDPAGFVYTSGTTGEPKGVVLTHKNFCANINALRDLFPLGSEDRSLAFLPWAHVFGQTAEFYMLPSLGISLALNDEIPKLVSNLPEVKPTVLIAVPRIFNRIYDGVNQQMRDRPKLIQSLFHAGIRAATRRSRGHQLSFGESLSLKLADKLIFTKVRQRFGGRLRLVVSGSAALSKEVAEFIDALGIDVYEGYGLTETAPVASVNTPGNRKIGSVGKALPNVRIVIDTLVTGDPKNGEIVVYGDNVMRGYHNRPEEDAKIFTPDRGLRTGDMGYVDEDGYLFITGRIKEQYKLENGKYVVPSPLEEELKLSPYIGNVMLHGANKPHNVALIVLNQLNLEKWATREGVTLGDPTKNPKVQELIRAELEQHSKSFRSYERPKAFALITADFTVENGMLTPKMSVRRNQVLKAYQSTLDALY